MPALLRFLFSFEGRATRLGYWVATLPALILSIVATFVPLDLATLVYMVLPAWVLLSWPAFVVGFRRCHDRNRSGWYQLLGAVPFIGSLWLLIELGGFAGTPGPNKFGADPLGRAGLDL